MTMKLDKTLKALLDEERISITALSKKTGVPHQTLHNWLTGMEPRSLRQVKIVAKYFGVSLDFLCFEEGSETKMRSKLDVHREEINAGVFEVVLRRVNGGEN